MSENDDPNRRSMSKMYPDSQQLFVGNLPHNIDETELQEFFTRKFYYDTNLESDLVTLKHFSLHGVQRPKVM